MAYYTFKEIWTPLKLFGIRFFKELDDEKLWIKVGSKSRRPVGKRNDKHRVDR